MGASEYVKPSTVLWSDSDNILIVTSVICLPCYFISEAGYEETIHYTETHDFCFVIFHYLHMRTWGYIWAEMCCVIFFYRCDHRVFTYRLFQIGGKVWKTEVQRNVNMLDRVFGHTFDDLMIFWVFLPKERHARIVFNLIPVCLHD